MMGRVLTSLARVSKTISKHVKHWCKDNLDRVSRLTDKISLCDLPTTPSPPGTVPRPVGAHGPLEPGIKRREAWMALI